MKVVASARGDASDQLDVRGMRADEAREAVRSFVDDAALAGLHEVTVVHGRGTGALRGGPRRARPRTRSSSATRAGSADGATVASLT